MPTNPPGYVNFYFKKERLKIFKRLGGCCFVCGSKEQLRVHHIEPIPEPRPSGQIARLLEWKKNPDNLMLLCEKCHRSIHTKM